MSLPDLARAVARDHAITLEELRGPSRRRVFAYPRQDLFWRARQVKRPDGTNRYSYTQIGFFCGRRDHTTVLHGERAHAARMEAGE